MAQKSHYKQNFLNSLTSLVIAKRRLFSEDQLHVLPTLNRVHLLSDLLVPLLFIPQNDELLSTSYYQTPYSDSD